MQRFLITIILFLSISVYAKHLYTEKEYQAHWCNAHKGKLEHKLNDGTRVDCLTDTLAVEVDFAPKWAECIGQSLYYGRKTNKVPTCVLIMERGEKDMKYLKRLRNAAYKKGIRTFTITPAAFNKLNE